MKNEIEQIEENILKLANDNNWNISKNAPKIAKIKLKFFGIESWERCPCYPPEDKIHGCGTIACAETIEKEGKCHCNLFLKK